MPSEQTLVGVTVPAAVVDLAVKAGAAQDAKDKRRHAPNYHVKVFVERVLAQYPITDGRSAGLSPASMIATVEDAAKLIVECLDPGHRDLIKTLARETQRPLASYILSPILLAREQGRVGVVVGEWMDKKPDQTKAPMPNTATCEWCGSAFVPDHEGQRFCPSPLDGNSCGFQWDRDRMHKARDPKVVRAAFGDPHYAPLPSPRMADHTAMMNELNTR